MEIVNTSVKSALEQLLSLHKDATNDMEFMDSGFDIIQTLLNNIHMAQSHMFASLIGNVTKQYPDVSLTMALKCQPISGRDHEFSVTPVALHQVGDSMPVQTVSKPINNMDIVDDTNIDAYMSQFSNISISAKNKIASHESTILAPTHNDTVYTDIESPAPNVNSTSTASTLNLRSHHSSSGAMGLEFSVGSTPSDIKYENSPPIVKKGDGPIDRWLREMRQEAAMHDINKFEKEHYLSQSSNPCGRYNIFNDDDEVELYNSEAKQVASSSWHDKVNMDVEQCCARIGKQLFMIDHMEPEFLDNYPSDTYIDENGFVHGRSCLRTIDTKLFNMGQIFCDDHAYGYEDIRKKPLNTTYPASPDIDFM